MHGDRVEARQATRVGVGELAMRQLTAQNALSGLTDGALVEWHPSAVECGPHACRSPRHGNRERHDGAPHAGGSPICTFHTRLHATNLPAVPAPEQQVMSHCDGRDTMAMFVGMHSIALS
jgi:hypothetical protein